MTSNSQFRILYDDNVRLVRKIVRGFGFTNGTADDLAQQAFVQAWEKLSTLQDQKKFTSWIASITRNFCLMELRRAKKTVPIEHVDRTSQETGDGACREVVVWFDPAEKILDFEHEENLRFVEELIKSYKKEPRATIVRLFYQSGKSTREIAETMSLQLNTVLSHLHRFRLEAKEALLAHVG